LTGQMHGFVLTNDDLIPVTNVVTWRDQYQVITNGISISSSDHISQLIGNRAIERTGNELREGIPICSLEARRSRGLEIDNLHFHSLLSFVACQLATSKTNVMMHSTDAAASGFFDVENYEWDAEILAVLGLQRMRLPEVTDEIESVGYSDQFSCPIFVAVGDQQASLYGSGLGMGELSLNIATGSQVSLIVNSHSKIAQSRPYFGGKFLCTVTHIPAGRSLNLLVSLVTELGESNVDQSWKEIEKLTMANIDTSLEVDLRFFGANSEPDGSVTSINEQNFDVGQLFRAAVKGMAKTYRDSAELVMSSSPCKNVMITGGLANRFRPLMQEIEQQFFDMEIRSYEGDDASLGGLKRLIANKM